MRLQPSLEPFEPTQDDPFDAAAAAHLLNRAAWGGTPEEIAAVVAAGPIAAVDRLLDFPAASADEISRTDVPDLSSIDDYPNSYEARRKLYEGKTREERVLIQQRLNAANRLAVAAIARWWLQNMMGGPYPLQEKLAFFWHGHFTTSARDERSAWLMWQQNELLRRNAAGNFREFVKRVSRDPAMLDYLNNSQNRKGAPNENYARELMELFTLGIGNYTEKDVKEAARAFTGWAHDGEGFLFRERQHDGDVKTLFGRRGNYDGDDVIELLMKHPACAPFIAGRMWNWFVSDSADLPAVQSLGALLRDNDFELRPVLRTLLTSKAFYDRQNRGVQIKSPVQLIVGLARNLEVDLPQYGRLHGVLQQMGQVPLDPPNVKGWPGGKAWINTSTLFVRYNVCLQLAGGPIAPSRDGRNGRLAQRFARARGRNRSAQQTSFIDDTPDGDARAVTSYWLDRLIQRPVAEERQQILKNTLDKQPTDDQVQKLIRLIVSMPEYQLC